MSKLLSIAVFLLILWVIFRVVLAVTSFFLHILLIVAVILAVLWLLKKYVAHNKAAENFVERISEGFL